MVALLKRGMIGVTQRTRVSEVLQIANRPQGGTCYIDRT